MNFNQAIDIGREKGADFILCRGAGGAIVVGQVDGEAVVANLAGAIGLELVKAGVAAVARNLYDVDGDQFLVGDVGQLEA